MQEIEQNIIGSLLIDSNAVANVLYLTPEMFKSELYGAVFLRVKDAFNNGRKVDMTTLVNDLSSDSFPAQYVSGELSQCVIKTTTSANVDEYGKRLFAEYKRTAAGRIIESITQAKDVDKAINDVIAELSILTGEDEEDGMTVADLVKRYQTDYFREKEKDYLYVGIRKIDEAVGGIDPGDITIIAARPAVGKSAIVLQMAKEISRKGKRVGYFNMEMNNAQVYERIIAAESGVGVQKIRHDTSANKTDFELFMNANKELLSMTNLHVYKGSRTVAGIRQKVIKDKLEVVIIDYVQLITPGGNRGSNRTAEVGDISRGLKCLATDYKIPIIGLSQLNRASEQKTTKEPTMAELRESGSLEQDASNILLMWNPEEGNERKKTIKVEKARNGRREKIDLEFDGPHMTFKAIEFVDADKDCPFA